MAKSTESTTKQSLRPPIVTVMGHVDHGKTSLLDYIRKANVQSGEYGGITQHIGAYQVTHSGKKITFIDTPGHAAFTQMRSRGGRAADIVILVVAADDGVMPQTRESIKIIQENNCELIVAINKTDLPDSNIEKIKQQLGQENVLIEEWGGDTICVEISAKTGKNVGSILDSIVAISELKEFKGSPSEELEAFIVEAKKDKKRGVIVNCIVKNGSIKVRDDVTASGFSARVRSLKNDRGDMVKQAVPGDPIELMGFKEVPNVGDLLVQQGSELADLAIDETRKEIYGQDTNRTVSIVLKSDTQGTLEAVKASLANLVSSDIGLEYSLKFLDSSTGDISDSDIKLAYSANGVVLGFNVKVGKKTQELADIYKVPVASYKAIYELIENVEKLLAGTIESEVSKIKGRALVKQLFKLPSGDVIAGSEVLAGTLKKGSFIRIYDKDPVNLTALDIPLYVGEIRKLKVEKDDVDSVSKGSDCGILLKPEFEGLAEGLYLEVA
jgi:translation initiation factor IF-2